MAPIELYLSEQSVPPASTVHKCRLKALGRHSPVGTTRAQTRSILLLCSLLKCMASRIEASCCRPVVLIILLCVIYPFRLALPLLAVLSRDTHNYMSDYKPGMSRSSIVSLHVELVKVSCVVHS